MSAELSVPNSELIDLNQIDYLFLDADDTLVQTDHEYFRSLTQLALQRLKVNPNSDLVNQIVAVEDIESTALLHNIQKGHFWKAFEEEEKQEGRTEERLNQTRAFPDVIALLEMQRLGKELFIVTHAPYDLAVGYTKIIDEEVRRQTNEQHGLSIQVVQTSHNYGDEAHIWKKPNPQMLFDLMHELGYIDQINPCDYEYDPIGVREYVKPVFGRTVMIGDSISDVIAGQKAGSFAIWINRHNKPIPQLDKPFIVSNDLHVLDNKR